VRGAFAALSSGSGTFSQGSEIFDAFICRIANISVSNTFTVAYVHKKTVSNRCCYVTSSHLNLNDNDYQYIKVKLILLFIIQERAMAGGEAWRDNKEGTAKGE